jgi:hypothetical protein
MSTTMDGRSAGGQRHLQAIEALLAAHDPFCGSEAARETWEMVDSKMLSRAGAVCGGSRVARSAIS